MHRASLSLQPPANHIAARSRATASRGPALRGGRHAHITMVSEPHAATLPPCRPGHVWYFAYGSNMDPSVLKGRRKVHPKQSLPAFAPEHKLSFRMLGLPYAEPGFATVEPLNTSPSYVAPAQHASRKTRSSSLPDSGPVSNSRQPAAAAAAAAGTAAATTAQTTGHSRPHQPNQQQQQPQEGQLSSNWPLATAPRGCAHGVLHCITAAEWRWLQHTEGVGSSQSGYQVVTITCHTYDGQPVSAVTLQGAPASLHTAGRQAAPSARYLQLLRQGAAHHGLDAAYQQSLQQLQPYKRGTWNAALGSAASAAVLLGAAAPAIPIYLAARTLGWLPARPTEPQQQQQQQQQQKGGLQAAQQLQQQNGTLEAAQQPPTIRKQQQNVRQQRAASTQQQQAQGGSNSSSSSAGPLPVDLPQLAAELGEEAATAAATGGLPAYLNWYFNKASRAAWLVHDYLLHPVLGSGSSASK